jgi:hypothetical protein
VASRTLNRRALRDQNAAAEAPADDDRDDDGGDAPAPKVKKARTRKAAGVKEKKPAKARAPRVRKKSPKDDPRQVARWAVCDNGMKRVAVFEYRDRSSADAKLIQIRESKAGTFFLVMVKDPYETPEEPAAVVA